MMMMTEHKLHEYNHDAVKLKPQVRADMILAIRKPTVLFV